MSDTESKPVIAVTDPALKRAMLEAEQAIALKMEALKRRKAPPGGVAGRTYTETSSSVEELIKQVAPDCYWQGQADRTHPRGTIPPKRHPFVGLKEKQDVYVRNGYMPLINNGQHLHWEGMPVFTIPQELHEDNLAQAGRESKERVQTVNDKDGKIEADKDPAARALTDEQVNLTRGT
jgi:hypothetical protein